MLIVGIYSTQELHDFRVRIARVGDAAPIENLPETLGDFPAEFRRGVHRDEVVIGTTDGEDGLGHLRGVEHRVVDVNSRLRLEFGDERRREILRPRIDVQYVRAIGRRRPAAAEAQEAAVEDRMYPSSAPRRPRWYRSGVVQIASLQSPPLGRPVIIRHCRRGMTRGRAPGLGVALRVGMHRHRNRRRWVASSVMLRRSNCSRPRHTHEQRFPGD